MNYLKFLEDSFFLTSQQENVLVPNRLEYLARHVFDIQTDDVGLNRFLARKAVEVANALNEGETKAYSNDQENYMWYRLICNMTFFQTRIEWGMKVDSLLWKHEETYELMSYGFWDGEEELDEPVKFTYNQWFDFIEAVVKFAQPQMESTKSGGHHLDFAGDQLKGTVLTPKEKPNYPSFREMLEFGYQKDMESDPKNTRSRLHYLAKYFFGFTYLNEHMEESAKIALDVCSAISTRTTVLYVDTAQGQHAVDTMLETPFFKSKVDQSAGHLFTSWTDKISFEMKHLWDGKQMGHFEWSLTPDLWVAFVQDVLEFAKPELETAKNPDKG